MALTLCTCYILTAASVYSSGLRGVSCRGKIKQSRQNQKANKSLRLVYSYYKHMKRERESEGRRKYESDWVYIYKDENRLDPGKR